MVAVGSSLSRPVARRHYREDARRTEDAASADLGIPAAYRKRRRNFHAVPSDVRADSETAAVQQGPHWQAAGARLPPHADAAEYDDDAGPRIRSDRLGGMSDQHDLRLGHGNAGRIYGLFERHRQRSDQEGAERLGAVFELKCL